VFRFEDISYLFYLGVVPLLAVLLFIVYARKRQLLGRFAEAGLVERLMPNYSNRKHWLKYGFTLASLSFLIFSAANPQWGTKKEKVKTQSADIFIALDISQSMMAKDISPSRLERSKRWTEKLVENLKGDRIGLIYFAGDAYLQTPLTSDYAAVEVFVRSANSNLAGTQGTAIDEAINLASKAYEEDVNHQRAMIIISDGEDHNQKGIEAAKAASANGMVIYTVGAGTEEGAFVPYINRGVEEYKKDKSGNPVKSKIDIGYLQDLANTGGGGFYLVNQGQDAINDIKSKLDRLQRREVEQKSFSEYNSYFQYFLILGILLCFLEWVMPETKKWYSLK